MFETGKELEWLTNGACKNSTVEMWQSGSNDLNRNVTKVVQQIELRFACILTLHDDDDDENLEVVEDLVCCQQGQLASLYWAAISSLDNLPAHVIFAVLDIRLCCHYPWLLTGNFLGYYLLSFIVVRILYAFEFLLLWVCELLVMQC